MVINRQNKTCHYFSSTHANIRLTNRKDNDSSEHKIMNIYIMTAQIMLLCVWVCVSVWWQVSLAALICVLLEAWGRCCCVGKHGANTLHGEAVVRHCFVLHVCLTVWVAVREKMCVIIRTVNICFYKSWGTNWYSILLICENTDTELEHNDTS